MKMIRYSPSPWPDETVGQLRCTGIVVTRRVSEGCKSFPRLRVGLPFRQATFVPVLRGEGVGG